MKHWLIFVLLSSTVLLSAQEICNNGIDDDGDGLIDLNDVDDCNCPTLVPSSLIPNPSFEDMLCCPQGGQQLDCAVSWIQASEATSDYFHLCGITFPFWVNKTAPQPIPDGEGYVGFRDGRSNNGLFKEYVGSCLTETMKVGIEYRLDFFLGFAPELTQTIEMTIFGTTECNNIPFGVGNQNTGCPTNVQGWTQLGQQVITGRNEWVNVIFDFVADKPYDVLVLGPGCDLQTNLFNEWYFFVDRLTLAEVTSFKVPFASIEGNLCEDNLTIIAEGNVDYGYQWFKDGIAIIGETNISLDLAVNVFNEGIYQVLISTPEGCFNSEQYEFLIPDYTTNLIASICEGESFNIEGNSITASGFYTFPFTSVLGCDSLVTLDLEVLDVASTFISPTLCEGESIVVAGQTITASGEYSFTVPAANGCDSIIVANLAFNPGYDNELNIQLCEGEIYVEGSDVLNSSGIYTFNYTTVAGCDSLITIDLTINASYNLDNDITICEGEVYELGNQQLSQSGVFSDILTTTSGCDSSIVVNLTVAKATDSELAEVICLGESYLLVDQEFDTPGVYNVITINAVGCDSMITLYLEVIDHEGDIMLPADTLVKLGDAITIIPEYIDSDFFQLVWTNDKGEIVSNSETAYIPVVTNIQQLSLLGVDSYGCVGSDEINIRVDRNIGIYTPNIFSPNGDGINDYFRPSINASIASLVEFNIYDRWGNLVHIAKQISGIDNWYGWDGKMNGKDAMVGVYAYFGKFLALDGGEELVAGDLTLVR